MPLNITLASAFTRLRTTNATDGSFASKVATATLPSGAGVLTLTSGPFTEANGLVLIPFGAGSANDTFDMRVIGWRPAGASTTKIWLPATLVEMTCTLSTATGVSGGELVVADKLCDTIVAASAYSGGAGVDYTIASPANNTPAQILLDLKGYALVEIIFDMTGATSGNCLYAPI